MGFGIIFVRIIVRDGLSLSPDTYFSVRETFFLNICSKEHAVAYPKKGDFLVDNKYLFEVGGKNKGFSQIKDIDNSYIVMDDVEVGSGNKIPLWLFGFLYLMLRDV